MSKIILPEGYFRVACSELRNSTGEAFANKEGKVIFVVDGERSIGPINKAQMEALIHVLNDVSEMKRLNPI